MHLRLEFIPKPFIFEVANPLDLERALADAERRLCPCHGGAGRRTRSDAGRSRLPARVAEASIGILRCQERPARATLYRFMTECPPGQYRLAALPEPVRRCLYNLGDDAVVPGHQVAFHAFHYGDTAAISFAAGLPGIDLFQADRMRGRRPRSRGLLRAVLRRRRI